MDVKELRLGNYIQGCRIGKVKAIFTTHFTIEDDDCFDLGNSIQYNLKPIPLTEDMLLNFGYEHWGYVKTNEYETYKRFVLHNFIEGTSNHEVHIITSTYGDTNEIEYVTSVDSDERQYNGRMEFVHDLQNAVYKETRRELTFK